MSNYRIFISSTFRDLVEERRVIQGEVSPKLDKLCRESGHDFKLVDLRWGISEKVQREGRTMEVCLEQIAECQKANAKPNFLILLGDRYGWEPAPDKISESDYNQLIEAGDDEELRELKKYYRIDNNFIKPAYLLVREKLEAIASAEDRLRELLNELAGRITNNLSASFIQSIKQSATHQEISHGVFNLIDGLVDGGADPREHVFVAIRNRNANNEQAQKVSHLESALRSKLPPDNFFVYSKKQDGTVPEEYAERLYEWYSAQLAESFKEQSSENGSNVSHKEIALKKGRVFVGREKELADVSSKVSKRKEGVFVIEGEGGSGKSAFMSRLIADYMGFADEYKNDVSTLASGDDGGGYTFTVDKRYNKWCCETIETDWSGFLGEDQWGYARSQNIALLREVVSEILDLEAPIHFEILIRRVISKWGKKSPSSKSRTVFSEFLDEHKVAEKDGDFYWSIGQDRNNIVVRKDVDSDRVNDATARMKIMTVHPAEIECALKSVLDSHEEDGSVLHKSVTGLVADLLGHPKNKFLREAIPQLQSYKEWKYHETRYSMSGGSGANVSKSKGAGFYRFVGTTSCTSDYRSLIVSLAQEIGITPEEERLLNSGMQKKFSEGWSSVLRRAAKRNEAITIFIDGIDQLRGAPSDSSAIVPSEHIGKIVWVFSKTLDNVNWIPREEPIVKTHLLKGFLPSDKINFIDSWLEIYNRKISSSQHEQIGDVLASLPNEGNALNMRLIASTLQRWKRAEDGWEDHTAPPSGEINESISNVTKQLETEHGFILRRILEVISASQEGMSEGEIVKALMLQESFWARFVESQRDEHRDDLERAGSVPDAILLRIMTAIDGTFVSKQGGQYRIAHRLLTEFFVANASESERALDSIAKSFLDESLRSKWTFGSEPNHRKIQELPYALCELGKMDLLTEHCLAKADFYKCAAMCKMLPQALRFSPDPESTSYDAAVSLRENVLRRAADIQMDPDLIDSLQPSSEGEASLTWSLRSSSERVLDYCEDSSTVVLGPKLDSGARRNKTNVIEAFSLKDLSGQMFHDTHAAFAIGESEFIRVDNKGAIVRVTKDEPEETILPGVGTFSEKVISEYSPFINAGDDGGYVFVRRVPYGLSSRNEVVFSIRGKEQLVLHDTSSAISCLEWNSKLNMVVFAEPAKRKIYCFRLNEDLSAFRKPSIFDMPKKFHKIDGLQFVGEQSDKLIVKAGPSIFEINNLEEKEFEIHEFISDAKLLPLSCGVPWNDSPSNLFADDFPYINVDDELVIVDCNHVRKTKVVCLLENLSNLSSIKIVSPGVLFLKFPRDSREEHHQRSCLVTRTGETKFIDWIEGLPVNFSQPTLLLRVGAHAKHCEFVRVVQYDSESLVEVWSCTLPGGFVTRRGGNISLINDGKDLLVTDGEPRGSTPAERWIRVSDKGEIVDSGFAAKPRDLDRCILNDGLQLSFRNDEYMAFLYKSGLYRLITSSGAVVRDSMTPWTFNYNSIDVNCSFNGSTLEISVDGVTVSIGEDSSLDEIYQDFPIGESPVLYEGGCAIVDDLGVLWLKSHSENKFSPTSKRIHQIIGSHLTSIIAKSSSGIISVRSSGEVKVLLACEIEKSFEVVASWEFSPESSSCHAMIRSGENYFELIGETVKPFSLRVNSCDYVGSPFHGELPAIQLSYDKSFFNFTGPYVGLDYEEIPPMSALGVLLNGEKAVAHELGVSEDIAVDRYLTYCIWSKGKTVERPFVGEGGELEKFSFVIPKGGRPKGKWEPVRLCFDESRVVIVWENGNWLDVASRVMSTFTREGEFVSVEPLGGEHLCQRSLSANEVCHNSGISKSDATGVWKASDQKRLKTRVTAVGKRVKNVNWDKISENIYYGMGNDNTCFAVSCSRSTKLIKISPGEIESVMQVYEPVEESPVHAVEEVSEVSKKIWELNSEGDDDASDFYPPRFMGASYETGNCLIDVSDPFGHERVENTVGDAPLVLVNSSGHRTALDIEGEGFYMDPLRQGSRLPLLRTRDHYVCVSENTDGGFSLQRVVLPEILKNPICESLPVGPDKYVPTLGGVICWSSTLGKSQLHKYPQGWEPYFSSDDSGYFLLYYRDIDKGVEHLMLWEVGSKVGGPQMTKKLVDRDDLEYIPRTRLSRISPASGFEIDSFCVGDVGDITIDLSRWDEKIAISINEEDPSKLVMTSDGIENADEYMRKKAEVAQLKAESVRTLEGDCPFIEREIFQDEECSGNSLGHDLPVKSSASLEIRDFADASATGLNYIIDNRGYAYVDLLGDAVVFKLVDREDLSLIKEVFLPSNPERSGYIDDGFRKDLGGNHRNLFSCDEGYCIWGYQWAAWIPIDGEEVIYQWAPDMSDPEVSGGDIVSRNDGWVVSWNEDSQIAEVREGVPESIVWNGEAVEIIATTLAGSFVACTSDSECFLIDVNGMPSPGVLLPIPSDGIGAGGLKKTWRPVVAKDLGENRLLVIRGCSDTLLVDLSTGNILQQWSPTSKTRIIKSTHTAVSPKSQFACLVGSRLKIMDLKNRTVYEHRLLPHGWEEGEDASRPDVVERISHWGPLSLAMGVVTKEKQKVVRLFSLPDAVPGKEFSDSTLLNEKSGKSWHAAIIGNSSITFPNGERVIGKMFNDKSSWAFAQHPNVFVGCARKVFSLYHGSDEKWTWPCKDISFNKGDFAISPSGDRIAVMHETKDGPAITVLLPEGEREEINDAKDGLFSETGQLAYRDNDGHLFVEKQDSKLEFVSLGENAVSTPLGVRYDCPETGKTLIGASNGVLHLYDNLEADPGNKKMLEVCESKFSHVAITKDFLYGYTVNDELWRVKHE